MFSGLSAFPLTPVDETQVLDASFIRLIQRLSDARVNSIGVLGSTGSYAYLSRSERAHVTKLAIEHANDIPVIVGIGALRTRHVIELASDAQRLGANAVMLAPVSYQKLSEDEVYSHFEEVSKTLSIPLCVYDNPGTTNFVFSDDLYQSISRLSNVASIKIPPFTEDISTQQARIDALKQKIPNGVSIGISGDWKGLDGLIAGCDVWYSAIAGVLPKSFMAITNALTHGDVDQATKLNNDLEPLLNLIKKFGSLRLSAAVAQILNLIDSPSLPLPVKGLNSAAYAEVRQVLETLKLQ